MKKTSKKSLQLIDNRQYGFWQAIYMAFYSPALYVDVARRWSGLSLRYLLLFLFCVTLPLSVRFGLSINQYFNEQLIDPLNAMPPLYIHHGEIQFDHFMPYTLSTSKGDVVAIIDTTGMINAPDKRLYPKLTFLITKDTIYFTPPPLNLLAGITLPFEDKSFAQSIDKDTDDVFIGKKLIVSSKIQSMVLVLTCVFYPCLALFFFTLFSVMLLAFAWAGQFFARVLFKIMLPYTVSFRMLMIALTPPLTLYFGLVTTDRLFSQAGLYYLALFSIYFSLGVIAVKRANSALVIA
jgi:hypothetical protein